MQNRILKKKKQPKFSKILGQSEKGKQTRVWIWLYY